MRKLTAIDVSNIIGTMNCDYVLLQARVKSGPHSDSDNYGIVLGKSSDDGFVTWEFHLEGDLVTYYWGHYFEKEAAAITDYETRE